MEFEGLQQALKILDDGTVTITKSAIPDIVGMIDTCYEGQAIVLSGAVAGTGDGVNETAVRRGMSRLFGGPEMPVVATFRLASGAVQVTLRYTLPVGADAPANQREWKFSDSFPGLPAVVDWRTTVTEPTSVPLDDLKFDRACFIVTNESQLDADAGVELQSGINFLGDLRLPDQAPREGAIGAIKRVFGHPGDQLVLVGTIRIPRGDAPPLMALDDLWSPGAQQTPSPGISLRAHLNRAIPLSSQATSALEFRDICFRIYSPTSNEWLAANPTYVPVLAYTGTLHLPRANLPAALSVTALQELGGNELVLAGRFTGASIGNFASLADIGGNNDLVGSMGVLQPAIEALEKLELMSAALAISMQENGGIKTTNASVMLGMPGLEWPVFRDTLTIESVSARIEVLTPLDTPLIDRMSRFRQERIDVTLFGKLRIFGKSVALKATTRAPFTLHTRLAEGETIPLSALRDEYPDCVPSLGPNIVIDYLALTATAQRRAGTPVAYAHSYAFAGRIKSEPKLEIAPGLALSEATVYVDADDANVNGEIGATLTLAGIDVRLKTQKTGASWRFIGSIPPGQSFNFEALLQEKTPTLTLPAFGNLPDSLTIDHADVSLALPGGAFDFSGKIELNGPGWTFDLGSASFRIDALHGEVHLSGNDEEPEQTAALAGSFVFGDRVTNLVGDARVKLGSANVDTVVEVALRKLTAGDASKFKVDKITDQLSGGHLPFKQLVPDRLLDRVSTLSQLAISINLSKGIYLARGEFEGASAYFLYQSAVSPATSDGYVFAAGLGETFKFENFLSELKPIDDVVTVKDAKLAIYAAPDQGLETLKRVAMEFQSANWPLPDKTEPGLERGLLVSATIQPGTSKLFDKVFQIGDVVDRSELSLVAQIEVSPETNSVLASSFRADIREIKFLEDTIRLSELKVAFTTRQAERELTLDGTLFVRRVFAKDYAFHGQLQLTSLGMRGKLELVRDASVTDIKEPFGLPGIEIKRLSVEVESSFSEQSTNRFALYGETLLGHPPVAGKSYNQVQVVTKLGLAQGRPVLMSLALQEHLDLGASFRSASPAMAQSGRITSST